jgi:hypothetical protein
MIDYYSDVPSQLKDLVEDLTENDQIGRRSGIAEYNTLRESMEKEEKEKNLKKEKKLRTTITDNMEGSYSQQVKDDADKYFKKNASNPTLGLEMAELFIKGDSDKVMELLLNEE